MELELSIEDLLNKKRVESDRIEFKASKDRNYIKLPNGGFDLFISQSLDVVFHFVFLFICVTVFSSERVCRTP